MIAETWAGSKTLYLAPHLTAILRFALPSSMAASGRAVLLCNSIEEGSFCPVLRPPGTGLQVSRRLIGCHGGDGVGDDCLVLPDGFPASGADSKMLFELLLFFLG